MPSTPRLQPAVAEYVQAELLVFGIRGSRIRLMKELQATPNTQENPVNAVVPFFSSSCVLPSTNTLGMNS